MADTPEKVPGSDAPPSEKVGGDAPTTSSSTPPPADGAAPERKKREYKEFTHDEEKATHANVDMSTIELKAEDLYDKEKVDLETIVIDDVFKLLQCDENGLSPDEATRRLELFGPNKLEQEDQNPFLQVPFFSSRFLLERG
jgi:H+-transporting ATPase